MPKHKKSSETEEEIPLLTLSGGTAKQFGGEKAIKEYRAWLHPKGSGDDCCCHSTVYKIVEEARKNAEESGKFAIVEPIIAVVFDSKHKKYREVTIDAETKEQILG